MFVTNSSLRRYYNIIDSARSRENLGYVEKHHVIPKCMGGNNDPDNIIALTAREHFICHRLLTKCTTGDIRSKLVYAQWQLGRSLKLKGVKITSRMYEQLKLELSESMQGRKRPEFSQEWKDNMSKSRKGKPSNRKGMKQPKEAVEAMRQKLTGRKKDVDKEWSEERRQALSEHFRNINKGVPKKKATCPHCGKHVAVNVYSRCHGDRCKLKS